MEGQELPSKKRTLQIDLFTLLKRSQKKEYWNPQVASHYRDLKDVLKNQDVAEFLKEELRPWDAEGLPKTNEEARDYYSLSSDKLRLLARLRGISNRSRMNRNAIIEHLTLFEKSDPTSKEMQVLLGKRWAILPGSPVFLHYDKTMMCGRLADLTDFIQTRRIPDIFTLFTQNPSLEELLKNTKSKDNFQVVKLQDYFYNIEYIKEIARILGELFSLSQNSKGFLLCKNVSKFALIAPIIFD